jgi:hypothetical protein
MEYISFIFHAGLLTLPPPTQTHFVFHFWGRRKVALAVPFFIFAMRNVLKFSKTNRYRVLPNVYGRPAREVCKLGQLTVRIAKWRENATAQSYLLKEHFSVLVY